MRDRLVDDLQSIELRQHSVENEDIEPAIQGGESTRLAVECLLNRMAKFP